MKLSINRKLILNILLFVVMIGIIIFVVRDSLSDIFTELGRTSLPVLIGVTGLGLISQLIEGYTIKNIAGEFNTAFTVRDGFLHRLMRLFIVSLLLVLDRLCLKSFITIKKIYGTQKEQVPVLYEW